MQRSLVFGLVIAVALLAALAFALHLGRGVSPPPVPAPVSAPADTPPPLIERSLVGVRFRIDRLRSTSPDGVVFFAEGGSARLILGRADDPTWEPYRTPEEALAHAPHAVAADHLASERCEVVTRPDGVRYATIEERVRWPGGGDQWHISRYVRLGDRLLVMQGVVLSRGDIDADFRSFQLLTDTVVVAGAGAAPPPGR